MGLPALLRDPARRAAQAWRCHRHVRLHRYPVRAAVAGYFEGPLGHLSPAVQAVLLDLRGRLRGLGLSWLTSAGRHLCDPVAGLHSLLLRPLPDHPAAAGFAGFPDT